MTNKQYADSLRMIADFYARHDELEAPYGSESLIDFSSENFLKYARAMGDGALKEFDKDFKGSIAIVKQFGFIQLRAVNTKSNVCTRRVVGTSHIARQIIPERIIEEHEEEIVEWDCHESLLAGRGTR